MMNIWIYLNIGYMMGTMVSYFVYPRMYTNEISYPEIPDEWNINIEDLKLMSEKYGEDTVYEFITMINNAKANCMSDENLLSHTSDDGIGFFCAKSCDESHLMKIYGTSKEGISYTCEKEG